MKTLNKYKQNISANKVLMITCLAVVLGLSGCEQKGTAEKAGQKIDRAAENVQQEAKGATEKAGAKIEAAKESLNQQTETAGKYIDESTDASKGTLEKAGKELDQATENAEKKIEGAKESVIDKAQSAGEYIDDSIITTRVKTAILNDANLKASQIEVTTVNGVVKLSGTVDSEQSINRAKEVAGSQKNVKAVETELVVNAPPPSK